MKLELNKKKLSGILSDPKMTEKIKLMNFNRKACTKYE